METWKTIKNYPDYLISNHGRIKSLVRKKEHIILGSIDKNGYRIVRLSNSDGLKSQSMHQLMAIHFLDFTPCGHKLVVDHIDFDKSNNHIDNLRIITQKENVNRYYEIREKNDSNYSKHPGVTMQGKKWKSQIVIDRKCIFLGYFDNEEDAAKAYQLKKHSIKKV